MALLTKAFVYAAGYGTRLQPYTYETPKPMLEVFGRPLVEYVLCYLRGIGIEHVTVNAAWLADAFDELPTRGEALGLDVAISKQEEPFEHGGDLAHASALLESLGTDERFLALNGDTLFWLDPAVLHEAAARVSEQAPLLILGRTTDTNLLRIADGRLIGIGAHQYREEEADAHLDDFGIKVLHASIRRFLPEPETTMSLHGDDGLVSRILDQGFEVLVAPVEAYERVEIGTVEDYEGRDENMALRALTERLCG